MQSGQTHKPKFIFWVELYLRIKSPTRYALLYSVFYVALILSDAICHEFSTIMLMHITIRNTLIISYFGFTYNTDSQQYLKTFTLFDHLI